MESSNLKTISEYEKKIKKYESKMRDLIEAYKCVTKEKETLEKTVASFSRQKKVNAINEGSSELNRLEEELSTLSTSIASMTDERRRMEKSYLEDKRVMRAEYETNIRAVRTELDDQSMVTEQLRLALTKKDSDLEGLRSKLIEGENRHIALSEECAKLKLTASSLQQERVSEKNSHESRVTLLEDTIADLSRNIGQVEKQHVSDTETIIKLNDRVQTLLTESRCNTKIRETQSDTPDILQFQDLDKGNVPKSMKVIIERMSQLRGQLHDLDPHLDLISIISGNVSTNCNVSQCSHECESKIQQLRDDLECSQLNVESLLRTKSSSTHSSYHQQEMDALNEELRAAKVKVSDLHDELSQIDVLAASKEKSTKESFLKLERAHKQELVKLRQEHQQVISDLQLELSKHRNRTINLLSEKDVEIQCLQRTVQRSRGETIGDRLESSTEQISDSVDVTSASKFDSSCPLYQCCETKARMHQELRRVRQQKRQLEVNVHKLEADSLYTVTDLRKEVCLLEEKLRQTESIGKLGTSINMEYLRNVFLRFLVASDSSSKYLMAKAIGKVLQISPSDLKCVDKSFSM